MPKISVLMPIYNTKELYLREAIESILNQSENDFEFLILNDSPENEELDKIVASYNDTRIKYTKNKKNLGITPSRNKLVEMAKSEYLAVMDHDDVSLPTRFEKEMKILDENPYIGVVACSYKYILDENLIQYPENSQEIEEGLINGSCYILHPSSMIRKSVLIDNNLCYEEEFTPAEDFALWCSLIGITKFYNIQEDLFRYRNHEKNTSHVQKEKMDSSCKKILKIVREKHKHRQISYIKILNIPLIKIKNKKNVTKYYLFSFLPILSITKKGRF